VISNYEAHDVLRSTTVFGICSIDNMLINCRSNNTASAPGSRYYEYGMPTQSRGVSHPGALTPLVCAASITLSRHTCSEYFTSRFCSTQITLCSRLPVL